MAKNNKIDPNIFRDYLLDQIANYVDGSDRASGFATTRESRGKLILAFANDAIFRDAVETIGTSVQTIFE